MPPFDDGNHRSHLEEKPNRTSPFRSRTNDANADAYKIFSILYGLGQCEMLHRDRRRAVILFSRSVIFIGGVAFSISHAIVSREEAELIKHLAEVIESLICSSVKIDVHTDLLHLSLLDVDLLDDILHHRHHCSSKSNVHSNDR